jgi:hypothetical protein
MKPLIQVMQLAEDTSVAGRYQGGVLRRAVAEALSGHPEVIVDFSGIEMVTQSAADEFVGRIMRHDESMLDRVHFRNCAEGVREMIQWAADNADSVPHRQHAFA